MIQAGGIVKFGNKSVRIQICDDFVRYYRWFVNKKFWIDTELPMHGAHITVAHPRFHQVNSNFLKAKEIYDRTTVNFKYYPYVQIGAGPPKRYYNFWLKVKCNTAEEIKKMIGIVDSESFLGLHVTICNTKNSEVKPKLNEENFAEHVERYTKIIGGGKKIYSYWK